MTKPNILFLFTDMQRADTIAALGNPYIKTPNLDRLVREGTAFTSCYTPSPVCVPARCSLQYGLYPQSTGCYDNGFIFGDNGAAYPDLLREAGYTSIGIGKCHFTPDRHAMNGFDRRISQEEATSLEEGLDFQKGDDYIKWLNEKGYDTFEPHGHRGEMYYIPQISGQNTEAHPTQWIADRSIEYFNEQKDSDQPWCCYSSFIHPHPPFLVPKPWHKLYRGPQMPLPDHLEGDEEFWAPISYLQNRYKHRDQGYDKQLIRNIKAYYYACISFVDYQVGRMLDVLEANGQLENTVIAFSSDHGEYLGDYGCFGKRHMHDCSVKVPMIIRDGGNRFEAGKVCDKPTSLVDILPTFCASAGMDLSKIKTDGEDLAAVANGTSKRDFVVSQFQVKEDALYMIADDNYKYWYAAGNKRECLVDRHKDKRERVNLVHRPHSFKAGQELRNKLFKFLDEKGVKGAHENGQWVDHGEPAFMESLRIDPMANLIVQDSEDGLAMLPEEYRN